MSDMKDHVPDLERCKRLEEAGFKGEVQFCWVRNEMKEWRVITVYECIWTELLDSPYYRVIRAPIVTELVREIQNVCSAITTHWMDISILSDGHSFVRIVAHEGVQWGNDTLPNALADLWMWLRERGSDETV